jgi:acyl-CoA synthetase (AMP-forming)/AMP-acid ligase II/acyl carrier protein
MTSAASFPSRGSRSLVWPENPMTSTAPTTIPSLLAAQAALHGNRAALAAADGPSLTYAELAVTIDRLATALAVRGIGRSSRVAVVLPNGVDIAIGLLAVASTAIAVPLAPQATADEYRGWFRVGRATHLLTSAAASPAALDVAAELGLPVVQLLQETEGHRITGGTDSTARLATSTPPSPADVAVVLMTSGSTGTPKRVPLTHANLLAGAMSVAGAVELAATDRVLVMWEQYHVGGLVDLLLAPLAGGGTAVCAGSFDAGRFFELLDRVRPTWFQGVPTTLRELLFHARLAGRLPVASTLRLLRSVAAPLPADLMRELEEAFGAPVIQTFGMTEAAPLITTNRLPPGKRKPGSTGTPCGCKVAVLDAAGEPLPQGATGEVAVRGPNVFAGYEDDPETNARVFRRGWFMTGDVGRFDEDGFLHLTGRVKEMINRGGEKIAPAEVEEAATSHPAVSEAAAFAIPHATLGEDVGLAVVPSGEKIIERDAIRLHIARHLSRFKVPAVVLVLDELPRCPIGKIRRRELADLAATAQAAIRSTAPAGSRPADDPFIASLAALWAVHLDLPTVGPDDNFEMCGGDSLSRIRLAVAVESVYGVSLPEDAAATITTVRRMAAEVRRLGGHVPLVASGRSGNGDGGPSDLWGDGNAATLADAAPADIHRRLAGSRTMRELDAARESLLNTLSLDELAAVVELTFAHPAAAWAGRLASRFRWPVRGTERLRVAAELTAWRREILTASAKAEGPRWLRERLAPSVVLYRRRTPATPRRLIISFAGNHQRLMLPTHLILDHLPPHDDLLLLTDPDRRHFEDGVRGIAPSLEGACDWIAGRLADGGYDADSVVCFGTSGGGLAAVCAAHALGCRRGVAVGIDSPANHPQLERFLLARIVATPEDRRPDVILAYDPANRRDLAGGEAVAAVVPNTRTVKLSAAGGHNTLRPAVTAGRLAAVLHDLLAADLGQEKSYLSFSASAA